MRYKIYMMTIMLGILFNSVVITEAYSQAHEERNASNMIVSGLDYPLVFSGEGEHVLKVFLRERIAGSATCVKIIWSLWCDKSNGKKREQQLKIQPGNVGKCLEIPVIFKEPGYYTVEFLAYDELNNVIGSSSTNVAVLPGATVEALADMGTCTHFAQGKGNVQRNLDLIKLAGFLRIRDELPWQSIEQKPGIFEIPKNLDEYIKKSSELNLKPLVILSYDNPVAYPNLFPPSFPVTDEARIKFSDYAVFLVSKYGSIVKHWEIWNEPHTFGRASIEQYVALLKTVNQAIKNVNSCVEVISCGGGGAGGGPGADYITGIIGLGGLDYQDGFSIHPYMTQYTPELGYPTVDAPLPRVSIPYVWPYLKNFVRENPRSDGKRMNIWVTELGWYSSPVDVTNGEYCQAAYAVRTFLMSRRFNTMQAVFWYDFQDDGINIAEPEHNFGLIRKDFSPKASYMSIAVMSRTIGNKKWVRSLIENDDVKVYQFGKGDQKIIAFWGVDSKTIQNTSIKVYPGKYVMRDWMGRDVEFEVSRNGVLEIEVDLMPKYIFLKKQ